MPELFYRDDDINVHTALSDILPIHEVFRRHNRLHTVACEMKDLWLNKALFWFLLKDPLINVELHGWTHEPYSTWDVAAIVEELARARLYWHTHATRMLGCDLESLPPTKRISVFFPPWNRVSASLEAACAQLGLRRSYKPEDCKFMFHFWSTTPREVEEALQ